MTPLYSLLAFLAAASLLTITPGLDTMLVLRAALIDGRRAAASAAGGILLGCLAWGAVAALGLGAVLRASSVGYAIVRFTGAAYLLWLGAGMVLKPRQDLEWRQDFKSQATPQGQLRRASFQRGLLTNLLNPKVGIFYVTFLPQFVPAGAHVAPYTFMLAVLHVMLSVPWFGLLICAASSANRWLNRPRLVAVLDRLVGGMFVAFGVRLAVSRQ